MKQAKLTIVLVFFFCSQLRAQGDMEVDGKLKVMSMDTLTSSSHVVVKKTDGTLALASSNLTNEVEEPIALPLDPDFSNYGLGYQSPFYYKHEERVYLQGLLRKKAGFVENTDVLATLPVGCRPDSRIMVFGQQGNASVRLNIEPDGEIWVVEGALTGANASTWISVSGISFSTKEYLAIGDIYAGGYIFYLANPAVDLDGDGTPDRGLVAALQDIDTGGAEWGCYGSILPGADSDEIGAGYQNTMDIIVSCAAPNTAAKQCADYISGGYDDWFLPSRNEIFAMFLGIGGSTNIGQFATERYWSSTEFSALDARDLFMPVTGAFLRPKNNLQRVRPIRAFE